MALYEIHSHANIYSYYSYCGYSYIIIVLPFEGPASLLLVLGLSEPLSVLAAPLLTSLLLSFAGPPVLLDVPLVLHVGPPEPLLAGVLVLAGPPLPVPKGI